MKSYDWLLAAARLAEQHHGTRPGFVSTAPELYALAARVATGMLDLDDMPEPEPESIWADVVCWLRRTKGIDVVNLARIRVGASPVVWSPLHHLMRESQTATDRE